ncbi:hypothetical protein D3C72_1813360 [compost metagenome]
MERLYSEMMMKHLLRSWIGRLPIAMLRSITEMVWPRMWATPRTLEFSLGIMVKGGHCSTSRTLKTLMPNL